MSAIKTPYLLFLGDAADQLSAKTAQGILHWRPQHCVGQLRLDGCQADIGLEDMTIAQAAQAGVGTMVIGVANRGGVISPAWEEALIEALNAGLDLASGLHNRMGDFPAIAAAAHELGRTLHDVRLPSVKVPVGTGAPRSGKRLLPVGTDCSCGKMYTALAIEKEMQARGMQADFRATGQTGILIAGSGVPVDAVVADFISGAVEYLTPDADEDHWDLIEGQGSLFHPSFAGVSTGLLHGAQADALVLCHEPTRTHMRGLQDYPIPDLAECMEANLPVARLTNKAARFVAISANTANLEDAAARDYLRSLEDRLGLPAVDPFRLGVGAILDAL